MDFFRGQFDYIYFFHGLSFLFLSLLCFNKDQKKTHALPWSLLGLFGLAQGISEGVDLFTVTYGETKTLSFLHPLILMVSYFLLFEFALRGFVRIRGRILARRWVYLVLMGMVFLGMKSAEAGLFPAIRYFLGFPAIMFASFVILQSAQHSEHKERRTLYTLSAILSIYAVFTVIIVPESSLLFAQRLNADSFYRFFKFPAQFVSAVLALCACLAVWFYSSLLSDITYKPQKNRMSFKLTKWGIILTIIVLIGLGWVFTNYLDYYVSIQIIRNTKEKANSPLNHLIKELTMLEKTAASLGRSSVIRNAVLRQKDPERVKPLLENFCVRFGARSCSLIDAKGLVISSAGELILENISDKAYIPRRYFKDALSGITGFSLSLGSKYNERVYYVSFPVKDAKNSVAGIVVLTKIIPVKPILQYRFFSILITFFVCILTITFFIVLRKRESLIEYIDQVNAQLREVDKLKTDFISIVSHELRTPLTSISNAATILMKGKLSKSDTDPREKELIQIVIKNVERQTRMVGDLLDVSKIEAGVMPVYIEHLDIVPIIEEVGRSFQELALEKNITLEVESGVKASIVAIDPEHTRRIVANLLTNAIKFTPEAGKIKIAIKDEVREVVVLVSDTGPGIPKEEMGKLFSKFYRASEVTARQRGGTGLGLMICKGLVEAQGGKIWLESTVDQGSTFYFSLPKAKKKNKQGTGV